MLEQNSVHQITRVKWFILKNPLVILKNIQCTSENVIFGNFSAAYLFQNSHRAMFKKKHAVPEQNWDG